VQDGSGGVSMNENVVCNPTSKAVYSHVYAYRTGLHEGSEPTARLAIGQVVPAVLEFPHSDSS